MTFRFASIPKAASSALRAHGLSGVVNGRCHAPITEYPDWAKYEWKIIVRPAKDWYESYWHWTKQWPDAFTQAMGLKFHSIDEDLEALSNPPSDIVLPELHGVNEWIPVDFAEDYPAFLKTGGGFMEYCYSVITCGIPCEPMPIADLDAWFISQGLTPLHARPRPR